MNSQDRAAIESIFGRLQDVERQGTPRDAEAEAFIRSRLDSQPGAAYYLAQTVAVQDDALKSAQQKIADLEQKLAATPAQASPSTSAGQGSFSSRGSLDSFFGRNAGRAAAPVGATGAVPQAAEAPPPPPAARPGMMGGGFLAGAAQTAMGVAGGMMLGNMLGGLFGGHDKTAAAAAPVPAAEHAAEPAQPDPVADSSQVSDTDYDDGNLFDDGGGFDDV